MEILIHDFFASDIGHTVLLYIPAILAWGGWWIRTRVRNRDQRLLAKQAREAADILTTTQWLAREAARDEEIRKLRVDMDKLRAEKDDIISKLTANNFRLQQNLGDLMTKVRALLHKLTNIEGYHLIEADVKELEAELKKEIK